MLFVLHALYKSEIPPVPTRNIGIYNTTIRKVTGVCNVMFQVFVSQNSLEL